MLIRDFLFLFIQVCLCKYVFGLQCYCTQNIGPSLVPSCHRNKSCSIDNGICFTLMTPHLGATYFESGCLSKILNVDWDSRCAIASMICCSTRNCNQEFYDSPDFFTTSSNTEANTTKAQTDTLNSSTSVTSETTTESVFSSSLSLGNSEGVDHWLGMIISISVSLVVVLVVIITTLVVVVIIYSISLHRTDKVAAGKQNQLEKKLPSDSMNSNCVANKTTHIYGNHGNNAVQQV